MPPVILFVERRFAILEALPPWQAVALGAVDFISSEPFDGANKAKMGYEALTIPIFGCL